MLFKLLYFRGVINYPKQCLAKQPYDSDVCHVNAYFIADLKVFKIDFFVILYLKNIIHTEVEHQNDHFFLWMPIFLAGGIALYFSLDFEPLWVLSFFVLIFTVSFFIVFPYKKITFLIFLMGVGFESAQLRSHSVYTPMLTRDLGPVNLSGRVEAIEHTGGNGVRVILDTLKIEKLNANQTPRKVRLTMRMGGDFKIGDQISVLAQLHASSGAAHPDGFDFARYLYFQGIGALGFVYRLDKVNSYDGANGVWDLRRLFEPARLYISSRIHSVLKGDRAALAMALMIGKKAAISNDTKDALRHAGLAHVLAISGLHIGLFSSFVFFIVRLFLVLIPDGGLKLPVKKIAATAAILAAFLYAGLAGFSIPTQRALFMTSVAFVAIILDRSPLSLRLWAFAAFLVLLVFPESLLNAGFHMSFAAVFMLIVFYDFNTNLLDTYL